MKFPYVDRGYGYLMPILPVTIGNGDQSVVTEALVDSGAGRSIFDAQFAEVIGITEIENGVEQHFEGISGHNLIGYLHDVQLTVGGNHFDNLSITFSRDMPDNAMNILGQRDFFDLFPIKFTYSKQEVELLTGQSNSRNN